MFNSKVCGYTLPLQRDICIINLCQLIATVICILIILGIGIYILRKYKKRCSRTLLCFHNLRSASELLLLTINTLEFASACLPIPTLSSSISTSTTTSTSSSSSDSFIIVPTLITNKTTQLNVQQLNGHALMIMIIVPFAVWNSILAIISTITLVGYHRIVEIKNTPDFLYVSTIIELCLLIIRIYKVTEVTQEHNITELESSIQALSTFFMMSLFTLDCITIYKQRLKPKLDDKSMNQDDGIGYKHSTSTFYSKIIFWWLTPLLWRGYHEPLEQEDLGNLREEDSAKYHYDQFLLIYKTAAANSKNPSLWLCYLKSSWKMFTLGGILKLFGDLSALVGPLSIHQIVEFIEQQYNRTLIKNLTIKNVATTTAMLMTLNPYQYQNQQQNQMSNQRQQIGNNNSSIILQGYKIDSFINPNNFDYLSQQQQQQQNYIHSNNYDLTKTIINQHHKSFSVNPISNNILLGQDVKIYYPNWNELLSNGWIIAWLVLIASLVQGGLSQASTHLLNMTGIRIKTSLQGLIYRKTLLLSSSSLDFDNNCGLVNGNNNCNNNIIKNKKFNITKTTKLMQSSSTTTTSTNTNRKGSMNCAKDAGAITNLMSEDALNIMSFFWIVHYVWAIPLKIGLVMYLLYLKLGISAIIGSFVCILTMTPLQFLIGKAMSKNSEKAAECTDERLKKTNDIFLGIKIIKLNAWEKVFRDKLYDYRNKELKYLNKDSIYWTMMTFLTHVSSVLITFVTLAVYIKLEADNFFSNNKPFYHFNNNISTILNVTSNIIQQQQHQHSNVSNINRILNMKNDHNNIIGIINNDYIGNITKTSFYNEFTASRLFSALALFNQLTVPLLIFPITVPIIISAIVSTKRLERFLQETEVQKEFEGIRNMARILSKSDASLDMYENDENDDNEDNDNNIDKMNTTINNTIGMKTALQSSTTTSTPPTAATTIKIPLTNTTIVDDKRQSITISEYEDEQKTDDGGEYEILSNKDKVCLDPVTTTTMIPSTTVAKSISNKKNYNITVHHHHHHHHHNQHHHHHNHLKKGKDLIRNSRIEKSSSRHRHKVIGNRDSFQFQTSENIAVSILNAVFSWNNCNTMLKIDNIQIPKGKLTIVVGKSGSGKTSFLSALLKEMQQISGEVIWNKFSTTAYVPQTPWLLNSSIRENILFGESFRPKRYEKVLEACALKPDIELMPENDMTIIGERGINLSGGQKQRIVIARSLYSSANVIIMDDPLSSLDNEVAKHVFENSIKKMLLKANRTVVLVTQRLQLTYYSDYIIVMKDGYVQCSGNFNDIERRYPELVTEWNSIMAKGNENDEMSPGKTARERWKLFKNVSKMGLLRSQSVEQNENGSTQSLYKQNIRRSSIFGSRHLIYDIPLPIDECQNDDIIIQRRGSSNRRSCMTNSIDFGSGSSIVERKNVLRVNSLQPQTAVKTERTPVVRNISSPTTLYDSKNRNIENDFKAKSGFRQFLHRMSSRKSNTAVGARIHRAISASNSIQSISEESHHTLKRSNSEASSEFLDDESVQDLTDGELGNFLYDEERKYGEIPLDIYILYLKSCKLSIVIIFFICILIWQGLRVYTDVWLRYWTDSNGLYDIKYYFNKYTIMSMICIILSLISTPLGQLAGCKARKKIYEKLLNSILCKPLHFFQITPFGRIINRFSNDMAIIDKKIAATSIRLLHFSLLCLCAVLINIFVTPWFILLTIPIGISYYVIQKFYRCSSRELQRIENITNSPVISHFTETIQGVTTIRAYSQESRFTEILFRRLEANTVAFIILNTSNRWLGIALDYLGGVIVFVAIITALIVSETTNSKQNVNINEENTIISSKNSTNNNDDFNENDDDDVSSFLSPSLVGLAINYTLLIPIYLNWVVKLLADMEMYVGSVERVAYYGNNCKDISSSSSPPPSSSSSPTSLPSTTSSYCENNSSEINYKSVPISWPQKGDIIFENICLRYQGQKQNVIQDLSLTIPAGQRIGICGRTGSGKSSLAMSLFSVLEVIHGRILIDDVDITMVHPDEIRSRLSIIPQDVHLFNATIRENLDPRGYYTDLELWNCLELAQLKDIVNAMPFGLDTEIIEGGQNLSAGHRQLFCLARAVLRGSVCLVLDEATSSLDNLTEKALLEAAHHAFHGRTIITIAHRLSTLLNYDRIIVLENGSIIEDGTPKELQQIQNGKFLQMLKSGNT